MSNWNNCLLLFITFTILSLFFSVKAQDRPETMLETPQPMRPSNGLVIGVLSIMFSITFCLLAYVKFCRVNSVDFLIRENIPQNFPGITRSSSRFSGIDKRVIESLPFFKFSSLKGSKEGLECSVCLSIFEETEVLRLLPKCKHAFHMNCIDKWLENHSSCPLCRHRVDPADIKSFAYSTSSRFLRVPSNLADEPNLEIFVQREQQQQQQNQEQEEAVPVRIDHRNSGVHKFNHKIVISDVVTRSRWSDLNSSDLLSLNSEMINVMSSRRFDSTSNVDENSFTLLNPVGEKRCMSEIANVPRFAEISRMKEIVAFDGGSNVREERLRRIWLQIAKRTVQWFARRETSSVALQHKPLASNV